MACGHGLRQPQGAAGRRSRSSSSAHRRRHPDPRLPGVSGHLVSAGRLEVVELLLGGEHQLTLSLLCAGFLFQREEKLRAGQEG